MEVRKRGRVSLEMQRKGVGVVVMVVLGPQAGQRKNVKPL